MEAVADLPQLAASFTIIGRYSHRPTVRGLAMEDLTGRRVDLDAYDIDEEPDQEAFAEFRRAALSVLSRPSCVFTYRPSALVSALHFARRRHVSYLGMFKDHQAAFEHKPFVECAVEGLGVPTLGWRYVADEDQLETEEVFRTGAVMLRRSRSSGGTGLVRVESLDEAVEQWPAEPDAFVSVAPYVSGGLPLNVGGVVWKDGVTLHPSSVQLIGIPGCTTRPFGYCGNDFDAVSRLDREVLERVDEYSRRIGRWLGSIGYRGAFGIDFLVKDGVPLFTEVNPRLQGSTHASCQIAVDADQSCILLDHLASNLDLPAPPSLTLLDWRSLGRPLSHLVFHSVAPEARTIDPSRLIAGLLKQPATIRCDVAVTPALVTDPGATVVRATMEGGLTSDGFSVEAPWAGLVESAALVLA